MAEAKKKTGLVVSAHAADFVWRCGGAVALYAKHGYHVKVVCLSMGERGESAKMWREPNMTFEKVQQARVEESTKACELLGGDMHWMKLRDYPMRVTDDHIYELAEIIRDVNPEWILTHSMEDPYNYDHPLAANVAQEARIVAQAMGHNPGTKPVIKAPNVYLYEPHQTEMSNWKVNHILDISEVFDLKRQAFELMAAQEYLWDYYTRVALNRGVQGERNSSRKMVYGEAYQRIFPTVSDQFV